jgi:hypothetical protein
MEVHLYYSIFYFLQIREHNAFNWRPSLRLSQKSAQWLAKLRQIKTINTDKVHQTN